MDTSSCLTDPGNDRQLVLGLADSASTPRQYTLDPRVGATFDLEGVCVIVPAAMFSVGNCSLNLHLTTHYRINTLMLLHKGCQSGRVCMSWDF